MTKSEKLCSLLGKSYFFKEMIKSNLIYITDAKEEKELADIILRVENVIIPIQIKEKTNPNSDIQSWLNNKVYNKAKNQIKITCKQIKNKIKFKSRHNSDILNNIDNCTIIPIIIFDANEKIYDYQKKYISSENNLTIHIFSIIDFELMCHKLIAPIEMIRYLNERINYIDHSQLLVTIDDKMIMTENKNENSMLDFYIYKYDLDMTDENINKLLMFNVYLSDFKKHCIGNTKNYKIFIKKMSHFCIKKIYHFIDSIDYIISKDTITWNKYILDNQQNVLFMSLPKEDFNLEFIKFVSNVFMYYFNIDNVLTIIGSNISEDSYELDFAIIDYNHNDIDKYKDAIKNGIADNWKNTISKNV